VSTDIEKPEPIAASSGSLGRPGRPGPFAALSRLTARWPLLRARLAREAARPPRLAQLLAVVALALMLASLASLPGSLQLVHAPAVIGSLIAILAVHLALSGEARRAAGRGLGRFEELGRRLERRLEQLQDIRWEINENEARYRDLLDAQRELIFRRDREGRLTYVNRAFCRTFSIEPAEVVGKAFDRRPLDRDGPEPLSVGAGARTRRFSELIETRLGARWIEWEEQLVTGGDGGWSEVQGVGRDMTEARRIEQQLAEARDEAEAASRAKSRFLASMSHEIRTPMNGILGMASLLIASPLSAEQAGYAAAIDQSARKLTVLIDEILDFSKIEAGRLTLEAAPFEIARTVSDAIALFQPQAEAKGLALTATVAGDVPATLVGDESRLRQVLLNLLSNALKFTDRGRIAVTVTRDGGREAAANPIALSIAVADTGIGLTSEETKRLFVEFERAEGAIRRGQGGTGLGLAISRRIVRAMGGDLTVESTPGLGATFVATLRLAQPRTAMAQEASAPMAPHLPAAHSLAGRVLLAEDNAINALLARRVLELAGCVVAVATNGREAVASVERTLAGTTPPFDLVLMDIFMPEIDGVEAASRIRAAYAQAAVAVALPPIIALTANAFPEDRERYLASGFDDYLAKPFDKAALEAVIARWLGGRAATPSAAPAA
jgi:PAS domain S-box-containing protein